MRYIKAPMNYIGNKYRIMGQLQSFFPQKINLLVDLFCGGCDVTFNTDANEYIANDLNFFVVDIYRKFQQLGIDETLKQIDWTIYYWGLTKENKAAYEVFRDHYNVSKNPLDLYVLMCFSFNYQFRFNAAHEYNNPFGKSRSSFNDVMRQNLYRLKEKIGGIKFSSVDFRDFDYSVMGEGDFLYADPPYLITCGSYNDGKRGFKGWGEQDERDLYAVLDRLDGRGIKFALSNVACHKGKQNDILLNWANRNGYLIHEIDFNYDNCNYQTKNGSSKTREILVTNYPGAKSDEGADIWLGAGSVCNRQFEAGSQLVLA